MEVYRLNILVVPSVIALILKVMILLWSHKTKQSKDFKYLIAIFAIHNICEIALFLQEYLPLAESIPIRTYYCASILSASYMVVYGAKIAQLFELKHFKIIIGLIAIIPCLMIALSNLVISGNEFLNGKYFATRGSFYGVFSGFVVVCQLSMSALLYQGYKKAQAPLVKIQCLYAGVSFLPIAMTVIFVVTVQAFGGTANTTTMLPLASTLFLFLIAKSEQKHGLTDIRKWIPYDAQWLLSKKNAKLKFLYNTGQLDLKQYINMTEKLELAFALYSNNRSVTYAAQSIGLKRSTFYSMMKRHDLKKDIEISKMYEDIEIKI